MAITRAQQVKQMLRKGGRSGYRFGGGYQGSDAKTGQGGASKGPSGGSKSPGGGGGSNKDDNRQTYSATQTVKKRPKVKRPTKDKSDFSGVKQIGKRVVTNTAKNLAAREIAKKLGLGAFNLFGLGLPQLLAIGAVGKKAIQDIRDPQITEDVTLGDDVTLGLDVSQIRPSPFETMTPRMQVAELTQKQKDFLSSPKVKFSLQEGILTPKQVFEKLPSYEEKGIFGIGGQEPTTPQEFNEYLQSQNLPTMQVKDGGRIGVMGGGMLVQPGFGGTRQGYRGDAAAKASGRSKGKATERDTTRSASTSRSDPGERDTPGFNPTTNRFETKDDKGNVVPEKSRTLEEVQASKDAAIQQGRFDKPNFLENFLGVKLANAITNSQFAINQNKRMRKQYIDYLSRTNPAAYRSLVDELSKIPGALEFDESEEGMITGGPTEKFFGYNPIIGVSGQPVGGEIRDVFDNYGYKDYLNRFDPGPSDDDPIPILPLTQTPKPEDPVEEAQDPFAGGIGYRFFADGGMPKDAPVGGIMDIESGRQMYFLGKLVKKAKRAVSKIVKSPLGKAALIGGLGYLGATKLGGFAGIKSKLFGTALPGALGRDAFRGMAGKTGVPGLLAKLGLTKGFGDFGLTGKGMLALGGLGLTALPFLTGDEEEDQMILDRGPGLNIAQIRRDAILNPGAVYGNAFRLYGNSGGRAAFQKGGDAEPVAKKTMPLLDMDGQEMDLRDNGGFVPIGRMERADDVPARLSKNEFVFTADAVRNAGGGDIDKGAEVMYNTMKNLEAGGEVSEETQGLEGARNMFQTAKRLEEVL